MKIISALFPATLVISIIALAGCAGSPVHTSGLNSLELMNLDDYTLCKGATPRELYSPSISVINEVRRRGLNCGAIYAYTGTGGLDTTINALEGIQNATSQSYQNNPNRQNKSTAYYVGETIDGFNKICLCLGTS